MSQVALIDSNGIAGSAIDGWTESNFGIIGYPEVPRLTYTTNASKWTVLQNFFVKNKLLTSRYATVLGTFIDGGEIPRYEGNPALVTQMTPYEGNALISTVYSSHYTSEISQAQIFMHDGTTLTTIGDSFEARGSLLRFSKDPILKSYYMDGENRFHYQEFAGLLRTDVVLENKDTNFWKQFFNTNRRLDTLTYGEMQGSHYYGAVLADPVSKVNSVLGGNITLSTHRLKTHTKKNPDDDYSFNLQLIKASFNQSEQKKILVKKYKSLTNLSFDNQTRSFYKQNSLYQFFITNKQRLSGRMIYQLTPQGPKTSSSSQEAMLLYLEHKYPQ